MLLWKKVLWRSCAGPQLYDVNFSFQDYLYKFGYMSPTSRSANNDVKTGIKKFQRFFGLPVTGRLDEATVEEMSKPRCGVPDLNAGDEGMRVKRYTTSWNKWRKTALTYYMSYGDDLSQRDQARIIQRAFQTWSDVAPKLRFTRTTNPRNADFRVRYTFLLF